MKPDKIFEYTMVIKATYKDSKGHRYIPKRIFDEVAEYARTRLAYQGPDSAECQGVTAEITEVSTHIVGGNL
jgi:hypothetical protein